MTINQKSSTEEQSFYAIKNLLKKEQGFKLSNLRDYSEKEVLVKSISYNEEKITKKSLQKLGSFKLSNKNIFYPKSGSDAKEIYNKKNELYKQFRNSEKFDTYKVSKTEKITKTEIQKTEISKKIIEDLFNKYLEVTHKDSNIRLPLFCLYYNDEKEIFVPNWENIKKIFDLT